MPGRPDRRPGSVRRAAPAGGAGDGAGLPPGFGVAVISGLADDVQVSETESGTSIRMSWPSAGPGA